MASATTPLMKQYFEVKSRYSDALVFFRMGDFYELFSDDALIAAKALEIALTSRNKNDPDAISMCGVPHHSATSYINKLVSLGHKVAICEQLEDPAPGKGIVKRDVVRVVSPGTRLDLESLDSRIPNYTHAAMPSGQHVHWATVDFTTGRFWFGFSESTQEWLAYAQAQGLVEILFPETERGQKLFSLWRESMSPVLAQTVPSFYFDQSYAVDRIREQFGVANLAAVHPDLAQYGMPAGALIKYFQESQKAPRIPSSAKIERWGRDHTMELDPSTIKALELLPARATRSSELASSGRDVSLLSWIDRTKTAMGARLLREWVLHPLTNLDAINNRHDQVENFLRDRSYDAIASHLSGIYDLERLLSRLSLGNGSMASARELLALVQSISKTTCLKAFIPDDQLRRQLEDVLSSYEGRILSLTSELSERLVDAPPLSTREGGLFKKGIHAELDELISLSENGEQWLARFEAREREATGISSLKVRFNRLFGYYIEITKANLKSAPSHYIRKQTMVGGERFITEELKDFEEKILTAEKKRCDLEHALFREYCAQYAGLSAPITQLARVIAQTDVIAALAILASEQGYARPLMDHSSELEIEQGRHPTVAALLEGDTSKGTEFVPNDIALRRDKNFLLITGPNMGGKSTVMRQTALISLLAQIGSFIPAKKARLGVVDRIFTRIGANDNIAEGSSTFMVEMSEMSFILRHASSRSLILIDEIGRGTSTYDGMSLAWALAADLAGRIGARTLFATHYHELTKLADLHKNIENMRVAVSVDDREAIRFLYKLEQGVAERSYGILVARLAGLSDHILSSAQEMLAQLESQAKQPKPRKQSDQLLFELDQPRLMKQKPETPLRQGSEPLLEKWLRSLDVEKLTPLQALVQLAEWKEKIAPPSASH